MRRPMIGGLHFGLGPATKVEKVETHWPDGALEFVGLPAVDQIFTIDEKPANPR